MKAGPEPAKRRDLSALRFLASVGEPLNPEAVVWGQDVFGRPFHDNWWQTETGGIMIANYASMDVKPGSMGRPLPGVVAAIVRRGDTGVTVVEEPGVEGELALRPGWPSMFRAYLNAPDRYAKCFASGWYLTGDLARRDKDGYFWFVGRADDVIKSAGHLIGPFEVESALLEHPAVAEAGVIGKPDPIAGEIVKAFVSLKDGFSQSEELRRELLGFGRRASAPPWRRRSSTSAIRCRARGAARSCAACSRRVSSGCRWATSRRWRGAPHDPRRRAGHALSQLRHMIRIRRLEEKSAELYTSERSAGFSTSTSARKPWPWAPSPPSRTTIT